MKIIKPTMPFACASSAGAPAGALAQVCRPPSREMRPPRGRRRSGGASGAAAAAAAVREAAPGGVLSGRIEEWGRLLDECEGLVREAVTADFAAACRPYLSQRRDLRLAPSTTATTPVRLDLSPALCEPLSRLNAELGGLRRWLPPASLRRVWPPIAAAIDELLYTELVRQASFSAGGVHQLSRDMGALADLFAPLLAAHGAGGSSHGALHRLHESCQLLTLGRAAREQLLGLILVDTPPLAQRLEHEGMLRRKFEERGVFRLSAGEVAELLASVQDDSDADAHQDEQ
jgi:hypothetical protein